MQNYSFKSLLTLAVILLSVVVNSLYALETSNTGAEDNKVSLTFRLPNETYPEHYDIKLTTNVHNGEKAFQGEVTIDIVVAEATSKIVLHARQLNISKVSITSPSTGEKEELSYEYEAEREFLILSRKSGKQFGAETKWNLTIIYNGNLQDDKTGFYISKYIDDNGIDRYLANTHFESINARHAFPCYDEPDKRANFTITIIHSPTYNAISNMPVNEVLSSANKTVFLTMDRISTYSIAFVVSDFKFSEVVFEGIKNRVYSRSNAQGENDFALVSGMLMVKYYSKYLGVEFTLPKIDYVAIPELAASGIENYGLIAVRENYLLFNRSTTHVVTESNILMILGHEIFHQWLGGYVTIQWWSYLWLKEGLATLFSHKVLDDLSPEKSSWQTFHTFEYQNALKTDASIGANPMTKYVEAPQEIAGIYGRTGSVTYAKAACVLHMWNNALTEKVFRKALNILLRNNHCKAVTEEEFLFSLDSAVKELGHKLPASIYDMLSSWTHQAGYPLLTVTRNYTDGSFIVKQEAFYDDKRIKSDKAWYVPINYAVASDPNYRNTEASHYLLNVTEMRISAEIGENDWLLLNKQSSGYYRVNYDARNWQLITESLVERPSKFHVRNRAQLMHDAHHLSMTGRLAHEIVLNLLTYLKQEDQYAPFETASSIFRIHKHYLAGHENYTDYEFFVAQLVTPIFQKLGADEVAGEQYYNRQTRSIVLYLACGAQVKECLKETNDKLRNHIKENVSIEVDLHNSVYCNGLMQSSDDIFNFFYQQLMNSTDQYLRDILINSLCCSQNVKQLKKYIHSSLDISNNLIPIERFQLLYRVYSFGEVGLTVCMEFLDENWIAYGNLSNATGFANPLDSDMRYMAAYIVSKSQQKKYSALLSKVKTHERVSASLESDVLNKISANFEWIKERGERIMNWVTQYRSNVENGGSI